MNTAAEFILPFTEMSVRGTRLRAARFPHGIVNPSRAMLCIPGYAAAGESFARLRPLAGECDVRLLTFPDEGWRHEQPIEHFGAVLADFAHHFDHPLLLGTSFGGLVAVDAAARLGNQLGGLILISTFARVSPGRRWLLAAARGLPLMESVAAHLQSLGIHLVGGAKLDAEAARELRRESDDISRREKHSRLVAALRADVRESVSKVVVPTLIIHGSDDHLVPPAAARDLAALLPHAELVEIAGAGHLPYLTHSAETNAAVSRFVARAFPVERHLRQAGT